MFIAILISLVIGILLGSKVTQSNQKKDPAELSRELYKRNNDWVTFLVAQRDKHTDPKMRAEFDAMLAELAAKGIDTSIATTAEAQSAVVQTVVSSAVASDRTASVTSIDNATLLLYLGAFLFLASVGLFLAFGGLPGAFKCLLVGLMTLVFYIAGLGLYSNSQRFKPAGLGFIAIGLIMVPLFGLSVYNYLLPQQAPLVWTLTSIIACLLYFGAYRLTRSSFVSYFVIGSILSLFESSVALTQMPAYFFSIILSTLAIGFSALVMLRRLPLQDKTLDESFRMSSAVMIPVALVGAVFFVPQAGYWQLMLNTLLAAAYYCLMAVKTKEQPMRGQLFGLGSVFTMASLAIAAYAYTSRLSSVAIVLLVASIVQVIGYYYVASTQKLSKQTGTYIAMVTAVTPLVGGVLVYDNAWLLSVVMAASAAIALMIYNLELKREYLGLNLVLILSVPFVWGTFALKPALSSLVMAGLYGFVAIAILVMRVGLGKAWGDKDMLQAGYLAGLLIAVLYGCDAHLAGAMLVLGISGLGMVVARYEGSQEIFAAALTVLYLAAGLLLKATGNFTAYSVPMAFTIISLAIYAAARLSSEFAWKEVTYGIAIIGSFAGALSALFFEKSTSSAIASLVLGGILLIDYSSRKTYQAGKELGGAVCMFSLQWAIWSINKHATVILDAHLWALLLAGYAYWRQLLGQKDIAQNYTVTALAALTLPVAAESLSNQGHFYGWLLIGEQIGLLLIGMAIGNRLVMRWGFSVAILAVLYQLRDLTFVVLGLIGLGVIGLAIYLLSRSSNHDDWQKHN